MPVNRAYLPRSDEERALCARTVYAANIDRRVSALDVRAFFEQLCGRVSRLRLLGDGSGASGGGSAGGGATRIAFVEFEVAESARSALNCSGALLGTLPLRVAPSKTPVRDDDEGLVSLGPRDKSASPQKNGGGAAAAAGAAGAAGAAAAPAPPSPPASANGDDAPAASSAAGGNGGGSGGSGSGGGGGSGGARRGGRGRGGRGAATRCSAESHLNTRRQPRRARHALTNMTQQTPTNTPHHTPHHHPTLT